jgi:hypothetical protein
MATVFAVLWVVSPHYLGRQSLTCSGGNDATSRRTIGGDEH